MCGIVGFVGPGGLEDIKRMNAKLVHRGPDGQGVWHDEGQAVYLAMRRLAVLDLEGGVQPLQRDGVTLVFNGEIYNSRELRNQLEELGHHFTSDHSDTETLLVAYLQWGTDCVQRLNGMWALAVYDSRQQILWCSRDRFGQKPFFFHCANGSFAFASELDALTAHPHVPGNISALALAKYFAYGFIPAPHTVFDGIHKLPAGHSLIYRLGDGSIRQQSYWDFQLQPQPSLFQKESDWCEAFSEKLGKAVERRLVADVPVGVFLSGGLDSSMIAAKAVKYKDRVASFSMGFEDPSFDELNYANKVADYLGTDHHHCLFRATDSQALAIEVADLIDEPFGDSSVLPTFALSRFTRQHVTVALGGDGADELLAGYDPFRAINAVNLYQRFIPRPLHRGILACISKLPVSHRNMSLDFKLKRTLRGLSYPWNLRFPAWMGCVEPSQISDLIEGQFTLDEVYEEAISLWDGWPQATDAEKLMRLYVKLYLQDDILVKIDRASMWCSLEMRSPFLDIDLVDLIQKMPMKLKFKGGVGKKILRTASQGLIPSEIRTRSKKGFGVPVGQWFANGTFSPSFDRFNQVLPAPAWRELLQQHIKGKSDQRSALWNLWLLEQWDRKRDSKP